MKSKVYNFLISRILKNASFLLKQSRCEKHNNQNIYLTNSVHANYVYLYKKENLECNVYFIVFSM